MIQVGQWHRYQGSPASLRGRPFHVDEVGDNLVRGRWPSGVERHVAPAALSPVPVADTISFGVDEPCMICGGLKKLGVFEEVQGEPWSSRKIGTKPCPNCAA